MTKDEFEKIYKRAAAAVKNIKAGMTPRFKQHYADSFELIEQALETTSFGHPPADSEIGDEPSATLENMEVGKDAAKPTRKQKA
jgi:hypothetical protein